MKRKTRKDDKKTEATEDTTDELGLRTGPASVVPALKTIEAEPGKLPTEAEVDVVIGLSE